MEVEMLDFIGSGHMMNIYTCTPRILYPSEGEAGERKLTIFYVSFTDFAH